MKIVEKLDAWMSQPLTSSKPFVEKKIRAWPPGVEDTPEEPPRRYKIDKSWPFDACFIGIIVASMVAMAIL